MASSPLSHNRGGMTYEKTNGILKYDTRGEMSGDRRDNDFYRRSRSIDSEDKIDFSNQKVDDLLDQMDVEYKLEALKHIRQTNEKIGFFVKLCNMTERVKLFNDYFCSKRPFYQKIFIDRKMRERQKLK